MTQLFDERACTLGEGPLWHPERNQLFWFDITAKTLLSTLDGKALEWRFEHFVSAAGWVDKDTLLIASETGLFTFDLETSEQVLVSRFPKSKLKLRSNDGRADPWGGFWISTMGLNAEPDAGAIYRFYEGKLTVLVDRITIPNTICFSPDNSCAYYADTAAQQVMRLHLDQATGMPVGEGELWLDLREDNLHPDGAVVDDNGNLWMAQWGAARVAAYSPDARFLGAINLKATHTTCPAFGGAKMSTLFCTSALQGLPGQLRSHEGMTFATETKATGQQEHQVVL